MYRKLYQSLCDVRLARTHRTVDEYSCSQQEFTREYEVTGRTLLADLCLAGVADVLWFFGWVDDPRDAVMEEVLAFLDGRFSQ